MIVKGMGGWWVIAPDPDSLADVSVAHNSIYEVHTGAEIHEYRSVGCKGWTEALPIVRKVESAMFRVPENDDSAPHVLGFEEGKEVTVYLKRGSVDPPEYDAIYRTIVKSVHVENDQKKARVIEVVCAHGQYVRGVGAPPIPGPFPAIPGL